MSRQQRTTFTVDSTGDAALDTILGGGLPSRSIVMIAGEPGSGKTVLTHQLLFHAARQGKKCLYFTTLGEPAIKVMRYMQMFDFFDEGVLDNIIFSDLGSCLRTGARAALRELEERAAQHEPAFIAIDSFKVLAELLEHDPAARSHIYDLAVQLAGWGATALLVGEYSRDDVRSLAEFGIADGILHMRTERHELTAVRELEVVKLRGAAHRTGAHFFEISGAGVSFFPRVSAPDEVSDHEATSAERVAFGVPGLDELVSGGVPQRSTTVVQGGTGIGKTMLALRFLIEGTRRGERGVMFTLEETPNQLRDIAASVGWDLRALEREGKLVVRYASPVELSTDRFLYQALDELQRHSAKRAVFDSLTTMALGVPSQRRFKEMVYAIAKHLRGAGVSTLMTSESAQLLGSAQLSGDGVSFIADNVIQLRYVEIEGRLERAVSVLKARGVKHNSELRSLVIDESGVNVVRGRFSAMRGVLTGLPVFEGNKP